MMATAFLGYKNSQTWFDTTIPSSLSSIAVLPTSCSERCRKHISTLKIQPKAVYENLNAPGMKINVNTAIKKIAGVYLILNKVNGNTYVGSAITGQMPMRFHRHLYGLNGSKLVAAAVLKYGLENFAFVVADTIPFVVTQEANQALLDLEDHYLQLLLPEYNIAEVAGNTFGVQHTTETKALMRVNYSSERRARIGDLNRGKSLSEKTIELIRRAALARSPMTDETRTKISANSAKANLYQVSRVDGTLLRNGLSSITLRTIPNLAKYCKCSEKTVRRALKDTGIVKHT